MEIMESMPTSDSFHEFLTSTVKLRRMNFHGSRVEVKFQTSTEARPPDFPGSYVRLPRASTEVRSGSHESRPKCGIMFRLDHHRMLKAYCKLYITSVRFVLHVRTPTRTNTNEAFKRKCCCGMAQAHYQSTCTQPRWPYFSPPPCFRQRRRR